LTAAQQDLTAAKEDLKKCESGKLALQIENDNQSKEINALNSRLNMLSKDFNDTRSQLEKDLTATRDELEKALDELAAAKAELEKAPKPDGDKGTKKK
jgi:multidrug resistance efflux pump